MSGKQFSEDLRGYFEENEIEIPSSMLSHDREAPDDFNFQSKTTISNQQTFYLKIMLNWIERVYHSSKNYRLIILKSSMLSLHLKRNIHGLYLLGSIKHLKLPLSERIAIHYLERVMSKEMHNIVLS
jgi:hypothetical protein